MTNQIRNIFAQPVNTQQAYQQKVAGIKPAIQSGQSQTAITSTLAEKYGTTQLDTTKFIGAVNNGRSFLQEGALGQAGALYGTSGAKLNYFA